MKPEADREVVTRLLLDLVRVPSVNPSMDPQSAGEGALSDFLLDYARAQGFRATAQAVLPGRSNILIDLGLPLPHTLTLLPHQDTVPLQGLTPRAADGTIEGGRLYGRGACDAKGSLAAMLHALQLLRAQQDHLHVNVQVAAMVDEEVAFQGVLAYVREMRPETRPIAAIVGEPTQLQVVIAHKGVVRFRLRVQGRAAHTSKPAAGINAIDKMVDVLAALRTAFAADHQAAHPLVGSPTLTVSMIAAGVAPNVVPETCTATFDRRLLPGELGADALAWCDRFLEGLRATDPELTLVREEPFTLDDALATEATAPIAQHVLAARSAVLGPSELVGVPFGSDGSKLSVRGGIPTVVLGPGDIAQAHTADEYVEIRQLVQAAEIYALSALAF
jgi:acetylornithine deacetylase